MMPVYRQLLVCLDLSPVSGQVLSRAAALAAQAGGRMTLLHVVEQRPLPDLDYGLGSLPGYDMDPDAALQDARSRLERLLTHTDEARLPREVVTGVPHLEITRIAEQLSADLIVLGSSSRTGLGRLLGSTARSLFNHAPCDVLAVRVSPDEEQ
ncbi:universal stress protein [Thioalkalivibrio thiocyanodenitrificans]|uniref:universal stress protein n=1 Tax=Thioalkalivibrio thiocyanodenitrificans TaxID=243063 RepID=UPI000363C2EF|nr:universal stress protein [Thioalkalivibrio thiocyanodenitrificans]